MLGSIIGAAINATASHINTGANALFNRWSANRQWDREKEGMSIQHQYALEQMNQQYLLNQAAYERQRDDEREYDAYLRDYNSPSAIRERAYAAGMSPEAVMGLSPAGSSVGADIGSVGTPSGPSSHPAPNDFFPLDFGLSDFINSFQQFELNQSVIDRNKSASVKDDADAGLIQKRIENFSAEIDKLKADARSANARSALDEVKAVFEPLLSSANLESISQFNLESISRTILNSRKALESEKMIDVFDAQIGVYCSQIGLNYANGELAKAKTSGQLLENEFALRTLDAKVSKVFEDYNLTKQQAAFVSRQISHIDWQEIHSEKELEFAIEKFDEELRQRKKEFWVNSTLHVYDKFIDTMNNTIRTFGNFMIFAR